MKQRLFYLILCLLFITSSSIAQVTFNKRYHFDITRASVITGLVVTDSCYYATGIVADTLYPQTWIGNMFCKFDLDGNVEWIKTLTDTTQAIRTWEMPLLQTLDGGFATGGYSDGVDDVTRWFFLKFDTHGNVTIYKKYAGIFYPENNFNIPKDLVQLPDSTYMMLNWTEPGDGINNNDVSLIKLDKEGNLRWQKHYGSDFDERPESLVKTPDGGFIIGANRENDNLVNNNFIANTYLLKTDSLGILQWSRLSTSEQLQAAAYDLVLEADSSMIVLSGLGKELPVNASFSNLGWNGLIFKLNADRQIVWEREFVPRLPFYEATYFTQLLKVEDGSGYLALGSTLDPTPDEPESYDDLAWLTKFSPEGDSLWSRYYNYVVSPAEIHELYDIQPTPDGGYLMGGQASQLWLGAPNPDNEPIQQSWLVKVDEYGCLVPDCHLPPNAVDEVVWSLDFKLYPNPASDYLNVWLRTLEWERDGQFRIINAAGQTVQTFKNQGRDNTYMVSLSGYTAGMYWLLYERAGVVVRRLSFVKT